MPEKEIIIAQTKKWIIDVVVGCNFCPFANREVKRGSIAYEVIASASNKLVLETLITSLQQLDENDAIETMFIILPGSFSDFTQYLQLVDLAETLLEKENYEGIYQLASFHPHYLFAGSNHDDPANYTNRSPYPMLHILREESLSRAIDAYPDTENIPAKNIAFAQLKGLAFMQSLKEAAMKID